MEVLKENKFIADRLRQAATLLEQQGANPFRVAAYRKAAETVDSLDQDVTVLVHTEGLRALTSLPAIGRQLAGAIAEMVRTGHWTQLERLRGTHDPEWLFGRVPGIGPKLACRVADELHIDTLEALEMAMYDGRLGALPGFGTRRVAMVRTALGEMLGRRRRPNAVRAEPSVDMLLEVDREYREKAGAGKLRLIAPKRFNPGNEAWLPILHTERPRSASAAARSPETRSASAAARSPEKWQFTVLYSNTALAHKLGRTRDWVVIYFHTNSHAEGQRTVVTETHGPLKARRVVRGRESECVEHQLSLWSGEPEAA